METDFDGNIKKSTIDSIDELYGDSKFLERRTLLKKIFHYIETDYIRLIALTGNKECGKTFFLKTVYSSINFKGDNQQSDKKRSEKFLKTACTSTISLYPLYINFEDINENSNPFDKLIYELSIRTNENNWVWIKNFLFGVASFFKYFLSKIEQNVDDKIKMILKIIPKIITIALNLLRENRIERSKKVFTKYLEHIGVSGKEKKVDKLVVFATGLNLVGDNYLKSFITDVNRLNIKNVVFVIETNSICVPTDGSIILDIARDNRVHFTNQLQHEGREFHDVAEFLIKNKILSLPMMLDYFSKLKLSLGNIDSYKKSLKPDDKHQFIQNAEDFVIHLIVPIIIYLSIISPSLLSEFNSGDNNEILLEIVSDDSIKEKLISLLGQYKNSDKTSSSYSFDGDIMGFINNLYNAIYRSPHFIEANCYFESHTKEFINHIAQDKFDKTDL